MCKTVKNKPFFTKNERLMQGFGGIWAVVFTGIIVDRFPSMPIGEMVAAMNGCGSIRDK